jgi:3-deoxy-manno-octulosonate cytidylyltransferase (CMP-KDO synthetase)
MTASNPKVAILIPARMGSTRLPQKPLADIRGKPMIVRVWEQAFRTRGVAAVIVATDSDAVRVAVEKAGGDVVMTRSNHVSGTDRIAEVAAGLKDISIFVNWQGDEPLLDPRAVEAAIAKVASGAFPVATLEIPLRATDELLNPSVVKVLKDAGGRALYFSRYPIPYSRMEASKAVAPFLAGRHIGLYVSTGEALRKWVGLPPSSFELAESLEQLRALQAGIPIGVVSADFPAMAVDTVEDLAAIQRYF